MFSLSQGRTYIDRPFSYHFVFSWVGTAPISIGHLLSYQFECSGPHLYQSVIFHVSLSFRIAAISIDHHLVSLSLCFGGRIDIDRPYSHHFVFSLSRGRTYIDRSLSCQFEFSGSHLYRSAIFLSFPFQFELGPHLYRSAIFPSFCVQFESRLHLYRSAIFLSVCVQFESGPHLYLSVIILSVQVCVLGPHLYRSAIFLLFCVQFESGPHLYRSVIIVSVWVWVGVVPIWIDHFPISLSSFWVFETTPISIGHLPISLSLVWISGPHLYQSVIILFVWVWVFGTAPISIGRCFVWLSWVLFDLKSHLFLRIHSFWRLIILYPILIIEPFIVL